MKQTTFLCLAIALCLLSYQIPSASDPDYRVDDVESPIRYLDGTWEFTMQEAGAFPYAYSFTEKVGFREIAVEGNQLLVNG